MACLPSGNWPRLNPEPAAPLQMTPEDIAEHNVQLLETMATTLQWMMPRGTNILVIASDSKFLSHSQKEQHEERQHRQSELDNLDLERLDGLLGEESLDALEAQLIEAAPQRNAVIQSGRLGTAGTLDPGRQTEHRPPLLIAVGGAEVLRQPHGPGRHGLRRVAARRDQAPQHVAGPDRGQLIGVAQQDDAGILGDRRDDAEVRQRVRVGRSGGAKFYDLQRRVCRREILSSTKANRGK